MTPVVHTTVEHASPTPNATARRLAAQFVNLRRKDAIE